MNLLRLVFALIFAASAAGQATVTIQNQTRRLQPTVPFIVFPPTAIRMDDTDASHQLVFTNGSNLTANRTLTIKSGDANLEVDFTGAAVGNSLSWNGTKWAPAAGGGGGTVTSVGVTTANGVSASGGPITGSGSFTFTLGAITPTSVASSGAISGTTGTFSALTATRVVYVGTAGLLSDAATFIYNGNLLVGSATDNTSGRLQLTGASGNILNIRSTDTTSGAADTGPTFLLTGHNGSTAHNGGFIKANKVSSVVGEFGTYMSFGTAQTLGPLNVREVVRITETGILQSVAASNFVLRGGESGGATLTLNSADTGAAFNGALTLGTPLAVAQGGTGKTSLGSGVADFLETPSSANLATAVTGETGSGALVFGTSPAFTTALTLANGSSPTTGAVAVTAFDTDAWAASRGAIQIHDGTANTYVVASLASDTPTNGQVPTWNTGGTITWEAAGATAGGSSGDLQYNNAGALGGYTPGTGVVTWLQTPSFANLNTALTGDDAAGLAAANAFTGINQFAGAAVTNANAMGALAIDVTKTLNTKTIAADSTFTFSGTPATTNTWFGSYILNSVASPFTLTIPSSYSVARAAVVTTVPIPASGDVFLMWRWDGAVYKLFGDAPGAVSNEAFTSLWNGTTTVAPSKDAVYDIFGAQVNYPLTVYGVGTAYALTNTAAAIDFGTTDPTKVIDKAGTYLIFAQVNLAYNAATVVAETATIKVRRTNNTAADVSVLPVLDLPPSTVLTQTFGIFQIPPFVYTTVNADDSLSIFANVSAGLGAGTIDATAIGTSLVALKLY